VEGQPKFKPDPLSAPGDFYVIDGQCISCGAPHAVAPDLIGWATDDQLRCIWKRQPETEAEMQQAYNAFDASCIACYRYAGTNPAVIQRLGQEYCDQTLELAPAPEGKPSSAQRIRSLFRFQP